MFTDYLFEVVGKNLPDSVESRFFKDLTQSEVESAVTMILNKEPIRNDTTESIFARFLFAKTLKGLLEDKNSELCKTIRDDPPAKYVLQDVYMSTLEKILESFGISVTANMSHPFIVPNLKTIVGKEDKTLGQGAYGRVYSTENGYAIKEFTKGELDSSTILEIAIIHYLNHPNVINIAALQLNPPKIALPLASGVMGLEHGKTLHQRKWIFYQIFRGLAYCHSKYIWHRDIKHDNILLFDKNVDDEIYKEVKIADFGLSKNYAKQGSNETYVVTSWWRAPELFEEDETYTDKIDVWSVGVMLLDCIIQDYAFKSRNEQFVYKKIKANLAPRRLKTLVQRHSNDPEELEVIQKTIVRAKNRITALEALNLPYFDEVRDTIDTLIPAPPIIREKCANVMEYEQELIDPDDYKLDDGDRRHVFIIMYVITNTLNLTFNFFFYAMQLFDKYVYHTSDINLIKKNLNLVMAVVMSLSTYMTEEDTLTPEMLIHQIDDEPYSDKTMKKIFNDVLKSLEFNLIFPNVADFVYEYSKNEQYTNKTIVDVMESAANLVKDFNNIGYSQSDITRMAFNENDLSPKCIDVFES